MSVSKAVLVSLAVGAFGVAAASPALAAVSGTEHFTVINTSTADNSPPAPISATGPIHAVGRDKSLPHNMDRFNFAKGSLLVVHKPKHDTQSNDPKNCTYRFQETGTYTVASGTGIYLHAHGYGTYTLSGIGIGCKSALVQVVTISANGPLSY